MRFCPFCAKENPGDERECVHCGKRLPVVPAIARPSTKPLGGGLQPRGPRLPPSRIPSSSLGEGGARQQQPTGGAPPESVAAASVLEPMPPVPRRPTGTLLGVMAPAPPSPVLPAVRAEDLLTPVRSELPQLSFAELPPMPSAPEERPLPSVRYLLPLGRAIVARHRAERVVQSQLHEEQSHLDSVLGEFGRVAREGLSESVPESIKDGFEVPAITEELRRIEAQEQARSGAEREFARMDLDLRNEHERWTGEQAELRRELERIADELSTAEEDLKTRRRELRSLLREKAGVEGKLGSVEKRLERAKARAHKAEAARTGKGAGSERAEAARAEIEVARREKERLVLTHDAIEAKAAALEPPSAELSERVRSKREALASASRALSDAMAAHHRIESEFESEREKARELQAAADREIQQRFVGLGTLLSLHRIESPRLRPFYLRIDAIKATISAAEAAIVRLAGERQSFDRGALQRGLITLGVAATALSLLVITLAIVVFR